MRKMKARSLSISYFALKTATLFFIRGTLACLASTAVSLKRDAHQSFPFPPPKVIPAHPSGSHFTIHQPSLLLQHLTLTPDHGEGRVEDAHPCPAFSLMVSLKGLSTSSKSTALRCSNQKKKKSWVQCFVSKF